MQNHIYVRYCHRLCWWFATLPTKRDIKQIDSTPKPIYSMKFYIAQPWWHSPVFFCPPPSSWSFPSGVLEWGNIWNKSPGAGLRITVTVHVIDGLLRYSNFCELHLFNDVITWSDFYSCVLYIIKLKGKVQPKKKIQTLSL